METWTKTELTCSICEREVLDYLACFNCKAFRECVDCCDCEDNK